MAIKTDNGWKCPICNLEYSKQGEALSCEQTHDVIYVAFRREDLYKLIQFVYTHDPALLSGSLIKTLMMYKAQLKGQ